METLPRVGGNELAVKSDLRDVLPAPEAPSWQEQCAPGARVSQGGLRLPTGGLVKEDGAAGRANAQVCDLVKLQGRAIGADAVKGEGRMLHPVVQVVALAKPRREVAGEAGLGRIIGRQQEVARHGAGGPVGACALPGGQFGHMEDPIEGQGDRPAGPGAGIGGWKALDGVVEGLGERDSSCTRSGSAGEAEEEHNDNSTSRDRGRESGAFPTAHGITSFFAIHSAFPI